MPYSIMLDAGHGGRDPGAVYNGRSEKDDTLALTLAVGEILQSRGVDVLYTRTTDVYETPHQKAMEANEAGVDFFVSIHRNSSPEANTYSGVESLIFDRSGIKLEMAEDINDQLEAVGFINLGVKERPGLVVLRRTDMPAVLVEVGFMSNAADLKKLNSASGRSEIAGRLFQAFRSFKAKYDESLDYSTESPSAAAEGYGVQIFALSKRLDPGDKAFKGYDAEAVPAGGMYKYVIRASSEGAARTLYGKIRKTFPGSFPVRVENGNVSPL